MLGGCLRHAPGDPRVAGRPSIRRAEPIPSPPARGLHPRAPVHALRLRELRGRAPARGGRGRPQPSDPLRMGHPLGQHGRGDVELRGGGPAQRAPARPDRVRLHRRRRRPDRRDPQPPPRLAALPAGCRRGTRAARRRLHRRLHPAPGRTDGRVPLLRQLVPPRRFPGAVRRADARVGPDLHHRPGPSDVLRRGELGPSRGPSRREARRDRSRPKEPADHDHRRGAAGRGAAARHPAGPLDDGRRRQEGAPADASERRDAADHQRGRSASRREPTRPGASIREDPGQVPERLLPVDAAGPGRAAAEPHRPDGRRHRDVDRILRHLALRARLQAAPRADAGKGAPRARR